MKGFHNRHGFSHISAAFICLYSQQLEELNVFQKLKYEYFCKIAGKILFYEQ